MTDQSAFPPLSSAAPREGDRVLGGSSSVGAWQTGVPGGISLNSSMGRERILTAIPDVIPQMKDLSIADNGPSCLDVTSSNVNGS